MRRLNDGHILELGVLQSLLKMVGGYGFVDSGSSASLSKVQLEGRCGSLVLRKETSDFGIVELVNVQASRRLRFSLQDDNCGVTFLILLSQLRSKVVYDESNDRPKQIKLVGNLYDSCQRTLNTLLPFLTDGSQDVRDDPSEINQPGAIAAYAKVLPAPGVLHTRFGVATADAWALCRPLIRAALFAEEDLSSDNDAKIPAHLQPFHPTSDIMQKKYHDMLPAASWNHITPLLFHRFYSYAIYDLSCPEERYRNEITRIKREIDRLLMLQKGGRDAIGIQASMASAVAAAGGTQRAIREATAFTKEHSMELDRFTHTTEMLSIGMKRQKKHSGHVQNLLKSEKGDFFAGLAGENGSVDSMSVFFTTCVYPRILLSPEDAMYCSRFIMLLHIMDTPGFFTLKFLDVMISAVVGALYSITEDEAGCLGIFLNEQWKIISEWRYDERSYKTNVVGKVRFDSHQF
jgi:THO complex subunit 2